MLLKKKVNIISTILCDCMIQSNTFYDFLILCNEKSPAKIKTKSIHGLYNC